MSEVSIDALRALRSRAQDLLTLLQHDLKPFLHQVDKETFRRKPDSPSLENDVNVTTTCSCLMALALTKTFRPFYETEKDEAKAKAKASGIFNRLIDAPWMSSGLTPNNPFSTTLMVRTFGFLKERDLLAEGSLKDKPWELHLGINDVYEFAVHVSDQSDDCKKLIYRSLSDRTRAILQKEKPADENELNEYKKKAGSAVELDLRRFVQSGWIYTQERFPNASDSTKERLQGQTNPRGYELAEINETLLVEQFPAFFTKRRARPLTEIAAEMARSIANFAINEYPASAAVVYWFIDGISKSEISLRDRDWETLFKWAREQFNRQQSLVIAEKDAMMDPIAMAMSACLCARLRALTNQPQLGIKEEHQELLPSVTELEHSIKELFKRQSPSGLWPKYFPLFHYQEAGSNFCFTFELLEALLSEFGRSAIVDEVAFIQGLEKAVTWCERNRQQCSEDSIPYSGWNSGGYLETLERGQPESWATAVVHMFLWEVSEVLSSKIQQRLLTRYKARPGSKLRGFDEMIDIHIPRQPAPVTVKQICGRMLKKIPKGKNASSQLRMHPLTSSHSALLFGPPGCSKTDLAKAVAHDIDWPLIQIDPSDFLRENLDHIYVEAEKIFRDLMDLSGVVILFDEMDALVQTRDSGAKLDTAAQFLTTFMLPKLTRLHDQARVIFFMATNFQSRFDEAIKRRGRFDVLLCMGPPTLLEKLANFFRFIEEEEKETEESKKAAKSFSKLAAASPRIEAQLEFYTFAEFKGLIKQLGKNAKDVLARLDELKSEDFLKMVDEDSRSATLRLKELQFASKWSFENTSLNEIKTLELNVPKEEESSLKQITRYVLDWHESRIPADLLIN